ncbi:MAG: ATP-dependent HslUV protease ATP-binding subunit HslU [Candidatus Petromonas sp.]|nr:ATP-dependent HslUV protease ATP-binding subunit HslU [Candidatus Petromonas sp.]
MKTLTPKKIVNELDKYIIGQEKAKRAVAVALRNRYRRSLLPKEFKEEIKPKNILMIGPTGVGKTEIARRLAKLIEAPFVKVEATKFTEVGYVGRDVESMIRDLVEVSIRITKAKRVKEQYDKAKNIVEEKIVDLLAPIAKKQTFSNPFESILGSMVGQDNNRREETENREDIILKREQIKEQLRKGLLENEYVEIEVEKNSMSKIDFFSGYGNEEMNINLNDFLEGILPKQTKKKKVKIKEARNILLEQEAQNLLDFDEIVKEAIENAEENGIIFLDEIDKIASTNFKVSPQVSREGVQRDILPIVEGSTVMTKYGPVKTDHILFIGAGAFHLAKISDLIPELQGRFPIRVKLESLTKENFIEILTKPQNALIKQYKLLLGTEGVNIDFTKDAVEEIANIAFILNEETENIGARRLHTVMESLLEDLSFEISDYKSDMLTIDSSYVKEKLKNTFKITDFDKYII